MPKRKVSKGKKIPIECLARAQEALHAFSEDELKSLVTDVLSQAKTYEGVPQGKAIQLAIKDVSDTKKEALLHRAKVKVNNIEKFESKKRAIEDGKLKIRDFEIKTTKNKDNNAQAAITTARTQLQGETYGPLSVDEIKEFQTGKLDDDIASAADGRKVDDPIAQKVGGILEIYAEQIRNPRMLVSDALSLDEVRLDRGIGNIHNRERLINAGQSISRRLLSKEKVDVNTPATMWVDTIKVEGNLEETAKNVNALNLDGSVNSEKLEKVLYEIYDNIITNKSDLSTKSTVANDRDALDRLRKQTIVFKNWESFNRYNKLYGAGTLAQALQADIERSAKRIGIAEIFGDSPRTMLADLKKVQFEKYGRQPVREMEVDGLFNNLTGSISGISSPTLEALSRVSLTASSITSVGWKLVTLGLTDISQVASYSERMGYGYWGSFVKAIAAQLQLMPSAERRMIAKQLHLNVESQIKYVGAYADAITGQDIFSKFSNGFYKWTGINFWDRSLKNSVAEGVMRNLGRDSKNVWADLNEQTKYFLEKFNINESEWEVIRNKTKKNLFTLDNVNELTNSELRTMWEGGDKSIPWSQYRSSVERKFVGLFDTAKESAVLDPGAYERMMTTGNMAAGTPGGFVTRMVMQFKSYPIAYIRRIWVGGMSDMQGAPAKLKYALSMTAGSFALGYLSKVLLNFSSGKSTQNFEDFTLNDWAELLAPGVGTFMRILDAKNQNGKLLMNLLFTPSARLIGDALSVPLGLATGNIKGAKNNAKDFAKRATPIGTVPFLEPYFDQMLGKKPYLAPGQKQIYGA